MNLQKIQVLNTTEDQLRDRLDRGLDKLANDLFFVPLVVREFIDASTGAIGRNLPDGVTQPGKDYYYQKIDSSVNAVTITPFGTQLIDGAASLTLSAQYDSAELVWDRAGNQWYTK